MPRYIDADALLKHKNDHEMISTHLIYNAPTADVVERKRGKWIRHSIGHENTPWGFDCSACGKWFVISEDTAEQYNFCPNCGAEMKQ